METNESIKTTDNIISTNNKRDIIMIIQTIMTFIMTISCIITTVYVIKTVSSIDTIMNEAEHSIENINTISDQLAAVNLEETINNVNSLAVTSQETITEAAEKINEIDIDALNQAITNLSDTVEPFSKFFKYFQ